MSKINNLIGGWNSYMKVYITVFYQTCINIILYLLKRKRNAKLTKILVPYQIIHSVIMKLLSPFICLSYNITIRTMWLMVAMPQWEHKGNPILKTQSTKILHLCVKKVYTNICFLFSMFFIRKQKWGSKSKSGNFMLLSTLISFMCHS